MLPHNGSLVEPGHLCTKQCLTLQLQAHRSTNGVSHCRCGQFHLWLAACKTQPVPPSSFYQSFTNATDTECNIIHYQASCGQYPSTAVSLYTLLPDKVKTMTTIAILTSLPAHTRQIAQSLLHTITSTLL